MAKVVKKISSRILRLRLLFTKRRFLSMIIMILVEAATGMDKMHEIKEAGSKQ